MSTEPTYDDVGATRPADPRWHDAPAGFRRHEETIRTGTGPEAWESAAAEVLAWAVKTRSGFTVLPADGGDLQVREGVDYRLTARVGRLRVHEPVRVVAVVREPDRSGFAYGTLPGHPVCGEEAFVVHRDAAGAVHLTLRSLTRASRGPWRVAFPTLLAAQRVYRRRYRRALRRAR